MSPWQLVMQSDYRQQAGNYQRGAWHGLWQRRHLLCALHKNGTQI
jgi:hypothetical protein